MCAYPLPEYNKLQTNTPESFAFQSWLHFGWQIYFLQLLNGHVIFLVFFYLAQMILKYSHKGLPLFKYIYALKKTYI